MLSFVRNKPLQALRDISLAIRLRVARQVSETNFSGAESNQGGWFFLVGCLACLSLCSLPALFQPSRLV